jgi:FkbM family methyltransferase
MAMIMKRLVRKLLDRFGYEIRRTSVVKAFVPFVREFNLPGASFFFWIASADVVTWYDEKGWADSGEFRALRNLIKAGDRILEIGSHHGFTGMLLARFAGRDGFVLGVEPLPHNAIVAQAQLGLNRSISNLQFIQAAGASTAGTVKIYPFHNSKVIDKETATDSIIVGAVTGDMLDQEYGPFDVIKVDVEGYELEVLKGCSRLLSRAPKLALELHIDDLRERGQTLTDIFKLIAVERYTGEMVLRPQDFNTLHVFNPFAIPEKGLVNVFLERKSQ